MSTELMAQCHYRFVQLQAQMNSYDAKHLHLLGLIQAQRWTEIDQKDVQELNVLIVCKYVELHSVGGEAPTLTLNPEGEGYYQRLSRLAVTPAASAPRQVLVK